MRPLICSPLGLGVLLFCGAWVSSGCTQNGDVLSKCKGNLLNIGSDLNTKSKPLERTCPLGGRYEVETSGEDFSIKCSGRHWEFDANLAPRFYNHYSSANGLSYENELDPSSPDFQTNKGRKTP